MPKIFKFKRGFKTFAEKKSIELRTELGIKPSYPLPSRILSEHLKVILKSPDEIPGMDESILKCLLKKSESHWSGVTLQIGDQLLVIVNSSHSKARQESDIMHELAHVICRHQMGEFVPLADGLFLRDYNEEQEKEAEWLGGCLQLPRVALHYHYKIYEMSQQEIAEKFNASSDMVHFRINVCKVKR